MHLTARVLSAAALPGVLLHPSAGGSAQGTVTGHGRFERVRGRPELGYVELYESNLFLSPDGGGVRGPSFRLGAPPGEPPRGDGYFRLEVPAGVWSILVSQPLFFIRPKVVPGVVVRDGRTTRVNIELPLDYSTYFTDAWTEWSDVWLQTFTATGTSITGVSWKLAGTNATEVRASIHCDNGDPNPLRWPLASPGAAKADSVAAGADNWVRWLSGEVPTTPGARYAVKLTGVAGGDRRFSVFRRDKDALSYANGRAYDAGGSPRGFDLNVTVFSDNDGTAILMAKTSEGLGELIDAYYGGRWGQTFTVTQGTSLAAVDVWAAGANNRWDLDFTFRIFKGGPGGPQVGPVKTTRAAYQAFGAGLHAVSYSPGEVTLEAGETYYVEFTNPEGFNPYVTGGDTYAGGTAWQDRNRRPHDLSMTILVYAEVATPPCKEGLRNGGFEEELTSWTPYGDARTRTVDTRDRAWFGDIRAFEGDRFHGNEINGCCLSGGLYQRVCAVPGHRYRASVWSNIYWLSGDPTVAVSRVGIDPRGGTDPGAPGVVWSAWDSSPQPATNRWRPIAVEAAAAAASITVFLDFRQRPASGNQWRINCFDLAGLEDLDAAPQFRRGDCNSDGASDLTDAVVLLGWLFRGESAPGCFDACDADDNGALELTDAVYLLGHLFRGGPPPPAPFPGCGKDATNDELDCEEAACR